MNVRQDWWKQYRKYIIGVVTGVSVFLSVKYLLPLIMPFFLALCIVSFLHPRLRKLEERGVVLPEKLRETARLRRAHPEATLNELAELHDPPTTKSTVNHRMRKLLAMAEE